MDKLCIVFEQDVSGRLNYFITKIKGARTADREIRLNKLQEKRTDKIKKCRYKNQKDKHKRQSILNSCHLAFLSDIMI